MSLNFPNSVVIKLYSLVLCRAATKFVFSKYIIDIKKSGTLEDGSVHIYCFSILYLLSILYKIIFLSTVFLTKFNLFVDSGSCSKSKYKNQSVLIIIVDLKGNWESLLWKFSTGTQIRTEWNRNTFYRLKQNGQSKKLIKVIKEF